jgi:hypothetical protein
MPEDELRELLAGDSLAIYVLRNSQDHGLGFCEFDHSAFPDVELKNFGLSTNGPDSVCMMYGSSVPRCSTD